jgi:hypothetical protein
MNWEAQLEKTPTTAKWEEHFCPAICAAKGKPTPRSDNRLKQWNRWFTTLIRTNEVFGVLGDKENGQRAFGDWGAGGCWLLARAAQRAWGGTLAALEDRSDGMVDHVLWRLPRRVPLFLDDQGLRRAVTVENDRFVNSHPPGRLVPFVVTPGRAEGTHAAGIVLAAGTEAQVKRLVAYFRLLPNPRV